MAMQIAMGEGVGVGVPAVCGCVMCNCACIMYVATRSVCMYVACLQQCCNRSIELCGSPLSRTAQDPNAYVYAV